MAVRDSHGRIGDLRRALAVGSLMGAAAGAAAVFLVPREGMPRSLRFRFLEMPAFKEHMDGLPLLLSGPEWLVVVGTASLNTYLAAWSFLRHAGTHGRLRSALRGWLACEHLFVVWLVANLGRLRSAVGGADYPHPAYSSILIIPLTLAQLGKGLTRLRISHPARRLAIATLTATTLVTSPLPASVALRQATLASAFPLGREDRSFLEEVAHLSIEPMEQTLAPGEAISVFSFVLPATIWSPCHH